jgi:hypothetical protein
MADWAAWGTSAGTLVLAGATFAAVRSSNRSARVAERALLAGLAPGARAVSCARSQRAGAVQRRSRVRGGCRPRARLRAGRRHLPGDPPAQLRRGYRGPSGYHLGADSADRVAHDPGGPARHRRGDSPPDLESFAEQQRDLYVPSGDVGFWQAARRDPESEPYRRLSEAIRTRGRLTVDLLYSDHEGGQPTITRFVLLPGAGERWRCDVTRHWTLVAPS